MTTQRVWKSSREYFRSTVRVYSGNDWGGLWLRRNLQGSWCAGPIPPSLPFPPPNHSHSYTWLLSESLKDAWPFGWRWVCMYMFLVSSYYWYKSRCNYTETVFGTNSHLPVIKLVTQKYLCFAAWWPAPSFLLLSVLLILIFGKSPFLKQNQTNPSWPRHIQ